MSAFVFKKNINPRFYITENEEKIFIESHNKKNSIWFSYNEIFGELEFKSTGTSFNYLIKIKNNGKKNFNPSTFSLDLGIDTYMEKFPEWNDKFFPTFFRCEKKHFFGYFMQPTGKVLGVVCKDAIASYNHQYNLTDTNGYGHRICYTALDFINKDKLPLHHPENCNALKVGETKEYNICFDYCDTLYDWHNLLINKYKLPVILTDKFILEFGEKIKIDLPANSILTIIKPSGKISEDFIADEYGQYSIEINSNEGFIATGFLYCRKPYEWYLKNARNIAIQNPPHATTHCESWYSFFSGFLASKHFPNAEEDKVINSMFDEIMPLIFDFENIKPKVLVERIQNVSTLISLLVDKYESNPLQNIDSLKLASKFADWLISRQHDDGGYYRDNSHYTCVIYPAKSMLELYFAEKEAAKNDSTFKEASDRHYESAKKAVDNLILLREDIGTEGEHTLEDGMLSCSALQIALFALTLPKDKQARYINAAEHMLSVHRCLEQLATPDCRSRGTSIRYWEAQYDILLISNIQTSPHGWSAWLLYALYYLYLLTAKKEYLIQLMNGIGACLQLMSLDGKLHWAFAVDPQVFVKEIAVPDVESPIVSAYSSVNSLIKPFRAKFESSIIGEQYLDMISGWYQTSNNQKVTGGHYWCPLFLENETLEVDKQGGCGDNDVHEIFKCLEEIAFKKAFIYENSDNTFLTYSVNVDIKDNNLVIEPTECVDIIVANLQNDLEFNYNNKKISINKGLTINKINS